MSKENLETFKEAYVAAEQAAHNLGDTVGDHTMAVDYGDTTGGMTFLGGINNTAITPTLAKIYYTGGGGGDLGSGENLTRFEVRTEETAPNGEVVKYSTKATLEDEENIKAITTIVRTDKNGKEIDSDTSEDPEVALHVGILACRTITQKAAEESKKVPDQTDDAHVQISVRSRK